MSTKLFVNLPVKDLGTSLAFFKAPGFRFQPQFSDETGACMVISEQNYAMLLTEEKMKQFTPRPIADATQSTEVTIALSCDQREEVTRIVNVALGAGGSRVGEPIDDCAANEPGRPPGARPSYAPRGNGGAMIRAVGNKDDGFMFQDGLQDLDGHIWEYSWMDPSHLSPSEVS